LPLSICFVRKTASSRPALLAWCSHRARNGAFTSLDLAELDRIVRSQSSNLEVITASARPISNHQIECGSGRAIQITKTILPKSCGSNKTTGQGLKAPLQLPALYNHWRRCKSLRGLLISPETASRPPHQIRPENNRLPTAESVTPPTSIQYLHATP
jgi:hypothetical protein